MCGSFVGVVLVAISKFVQPEPVTINEDDIPEQENVQEIAEELNAAVVEKTNTDYFIGVLCGVFAALCFSLLGVATRKS